MREIKFRGWNGKSFIYNGAPVPEIGGGVCFVRDGYDRLIYEMDVHISEQYTGLKDKNGVEIYEGDIISDSNGKAGLVKWFISDACFELVDLVEITMNGIDAEEPAYEMDTSKGWVALEIIGNIHQNPELLK